MDDSAVVKARLEKKLSDLTACDPRLVRMADYDQETLEATFHKAARLKNAETYLNIAGGTVLLAALVLGAYIKDEDLTARKIWPIVPAAMAVFAASRISDRRHRMGIEIGHDALKDFWYRSADQNISSRYQPLQQHFEKYNIQQNCKKHNRQEP